MSTPDTLPFSEAIHCAGDAHSTNLRLARMIVETTACEIRSALLAVRKIRVDLDASKSIARILGDLEDDDFAAILIERVFFGYAKKITSEIQCAKALARLEISDDPDLDELPPREAWETLGTLAAALSAHGESIAQLRRAEFSAARIA